MKSGREDGEPGDANGRSGGGREELSNAGGASEALSSASSQTSTASSMASTGVDARSVFALMEAAKKKEEKRAGNDMKGAVLPNF